MQTGFTKAVNLRIREFVAQEYLGDDRVLQLVHTRLRAKFEEPRSDTAAKRREDAWSRWIGFDEAPRNKRVLGPNWAKARLFVHEVLSVYRMGELTFTNGSNFTPV